MHDGAREDRFTKGLMKDLPLVTDILLLYNYVGRIIRSEIFVENGLGDCRQRGDKTFICR